MPREDAAAKRFAVHIAKHGEIYKGATRDAKTLAELAGVPWEDVEKKVANDAARAEKSGVIQDDSNDDDETDDDSTATK